MEKNHTILVHLYANFDVIRLGIITLDIILIHNLRYLIPNDA